MAGSGLTEWSRFDVPGMWSMLRDASTSEAFTQAGAWQNTYEAAQSLAWRLRVYRDGLSAKWSPATSEAAAAYMGRLDELIGSAQQLADAAVANRQALVTLAHAVDDARPKMQRVYEQSEALRTSQPLPRAVPSAAQRQQELHRQGTQIMESLGDAALDSWRHYAVVDDYQPPPPAYQDEVPITIPVEMSPGEPGGDPLARATPVDDMSAVRSTASTVMPLDGDWHTGVPASVARTSGNPAPARAFPTGSLKPRIPLSGPLMDTSSNLLPVAAVVTDPTSEESVRAARPGRAADARLDLPQLTQRVGGVFGGSVEADSVSADLAGDGRANAVGGVIGERGEDIGALPTGMPAGGAQGGHSRRRQLSPESTWPVTAGGPHILVPGPDPGSFDPGPGVLGIDR